LAEAGVVTSAAESKTTKTKGNLIIPLSTGGWMGCVADELRSQFSRPLMMQER
jgi:hypothetical protein